MEGTLIGTLRSRIFAALGCPLPNGTRVLRREKSNGPQKHNDYAAATRIAEWGKARGVDPKKPHFAADVLVVFLRDKGLRDDDIDKASLSELASFLDSPKTSDAMVGPLSRGEWAKRFKRSVQTFDRWKRDGIFHWDETAPRLIRIHRDDVQRLEEKQ